MNKSSLNKVENLCHDDKSSLNKKEAEEVLKIMTSADGGCPHCAGRLMEMFIGKFGFKDEAKAIYRESFDEDLFEEEEVKNGRKKIKR